MKVGIIGAMAQEIDVLRRDLQSVRRQTRGMREYQEGILYGKEVVLTFFAMGQGCGRIHSHHADRGV